MWFCRHIKNHNSRSNQKHFIALWKVTKLLIKVFGESLVAFRLQMVGDKSISVQICSDSCLVFIIVNEEKEESLAF